jgi:hypothetical protein
VMSCAKAKVPLVNSNVSTRRGFIVFYRVTRFTGLTRRQARSPQ